MPDAQHIIERIRAFMGSSDQARSPELVELAEGYAGLCRDANSRLRRARDYIRQGLRAEAIHEADEAPPLLDVVALLDIPEARDWAHACAIYEIPRPPPLLIEAAEELNEAYAAAQPVAALLKRHRKLALQRAPMSQRLGVVRELADLDLGTPFWPEDVFAYESARLRELQSEAQTAARDGDREAMQRLQTEVTTTAWRTEVPIELRKLIDHTTAGWRRDDSLREMSRLLPELEIAHSAMDFDTAVILLRQIRQLVTDTPLEVTDALADRVGPARDWVAAERARRQNQAQFQAACDQLSLALAADAPAPELERLRREATGLGLEMPAELSRKLRDVAARREATRARRVLRSRLIVVGIVVACAGMMTLVAFATIRDRRARDAYVALSRQVGEGNWEEARRTWNTLRELAPGAADRPDFKRLREQIDDADAREQTRRESFTTRLRAASAAPVDRPDSTALADAESLARTPEETAQVTELRTKIDAARRDARAKQLEALKQELASLITETRWIEGEAQASRVGPTHPSFGKAEATAGRLAGSDLATADVKREAIAIRARLKVAREALARQVAERDAMNDVVRGAASPATLGSALLAFVAKLPDSPRVDAFKKAAADLPAWNAVEEAALLLESWDGKLRPPLNAISRRFEGLDAYLKKFPDSPLAPAFDDYRSYVNVEQRALASDGPWRGELTTLMASPVLKDFRSIRTTDGKVYYLPPESTPQSDSLGISFNAVLSGDVSNVHRVSLKPAQVLGSLTDSPQTLLSRDLLKRLIELNDGNWDTFGLGVIDTILLQKDVDPVLRIILLTRCARLAEEATWGAGEALRALQTVLGELNAEDIAWMNPGDKAANDAREKARSILARLSPLKELRGVIVARREAMFKTMRLKIVGHGVLLREPTGWVVAPVAKVDAGLQAWVVITDNGHKVLARIGGATPDGAVAIDPEALRGAGEGTQVFLLAAP